MRTMYSLALIREAMIKTSRKKITGGDVDKKGILASYLGHWKLVTRTMRTLWSFLKKLKIEIRMIQISCLWAYIQIKP